MNARRRIVSKLFQSIDEPDAGEKWARLFEYFWPEYQKWFLSEGDAARPSYGECIKQIRQHMPELESTYRTMTELAGGGDLASRFLSMYCPACLFIRLYSGGLDGR